VVPHHTPYDFQAFSSYNLTISALPNIPSKHIMSSPLKRKAIDHIEDFVPKKKVLVQINKTNLYVYPDVTPKMGDNERSLTFAINKTALVNTRSISFN
jgi:hypothetical protein